MEGSAERIADELEVTHIRQMHNLLHLKNADVYKLEFCPPIDSALLRAILLDFDLGDQEALDKARHTLDSIKATAVDEEADSTFEPTGTAGNVQNVPSTNTNSERADAKSIGLTNSFATLSCDWRSSSDASSPVDGTDLDALDLETKTVLLLELFPSVGSYTVSHTLAKSGLNWQRALDELLNISAFASEPGSDGERISHRGIDAFAEGRTVKRGRRRKPKGVNSRAGFDDRRPHSASSSEPTGLPALNKWRTASSDIDFICKHTGLSLTSVRPAYHASHASVAATITHLLQDLIKSTSHIARLDASLEMQATELGRKFPTIAPELLAAIMQMTHPASASAEMLAKALEAKHSVSSPGAIIPLYAPTTLPVGQSSDSGDHRVYALPELNRGIDSHLASSHREEHRRLSAQAQAAYRRSKSQRLMGGAAAYYSSVARDHAESAAAHTSAAADALVRSQSTDNQLDLHGVIVSDAVRIANRETKLWWHQLGESKVNGRIGALAREAGFRIVVGIGRHSEGGKSKIGPAVYSSLINGGWKVEKAEGVLIVHGKTGARKV